MILAVADTGPIIHLDEINALGLLTAVDKLLIPQTVYNELGVGTIPPALAEIDYDLIDADATELSANIDLDPGEIAALAVAADRSAVLLTDFDVGVRRVTLSRFVLPVSVED